MKIIFTIIILFLSIRGSLPHCLWHGWSGWSSCNKVCNGISTRIKYNYHGGCHNLHGQRFCNQQCQNGSPKGDICTKCSPGWRGFCCHIGNTTLFTNQNYCFILNNFLDINECANSNGGCSQICLNSAGSYSCQCNVGFRLAPDKHLCERMMNECCFILF